MHERPQAPLFQALRELGYQIDSPNDRLPAVIHGTGPHTGKCQVSVEKSSQFASALLMPSVIAGWQVEIVGENPEESPYVLMTREMYSYFYWSRKDSPHPEYGIKDNIYPIDPDSSSGSYFWAAGWITGTADSGEPNPVAVARWPIFGAGFQIDTKLPRDAGNHFPANGSRRQHHDGHRHRAVCRSSREIHKPGQAAFAGMRARRRVADGIDRVRREGG
jgi:3-phosphoshikimate 1-carboxyvinyltransferase